MLGSTWAGRANFRQTLLSAKIVFRLSHILNPAMREFLEKFPFQGLVARIQSRVI